MRSLTVLSGVAVPVTMPNLDTDQLLPKQFLKVVERDGLKRALFYDFRFDAEGRPKPGFILDEPGYAGAAILIGGENFGCGSSREHAVWALDDFGIRCVIAPSFGDIFFNNCVNNGLLPLVLPAEQVAALAAEATPGAATFIVDLPGQTVTAPSGRVFRFDIDPGRKLKLIKGLDAIGETLEHEAAITAYEVRARQERPWLFAGTN
jgi:3-isopropylmalate/(R)-2-methylmalate dehydratase small subunit